METFFEKLGLNQGTHRCSREVLYTAMIIFHICLKNKENKNMKFDIKMTLISSLRIAAVSKDIEFQQDKYAKVYYDHVSSEPRARPEEEVQSPQSMRTGLGLPMHKQQGEYISYDKIANNLRTNFIQN